MRVLKLFLMFSLGLVANSQPYKKEITFTEVSEATLVRVKIDKEIYENTQKGYGSIRLKSLSATEGYFIEKEQMKNVVTYQRLRASSYEREKAKLNYTFKEPFEVEELLLSIEDRNFESLVDVYADGTLVSQANKIFDYSNETGTQNFKIKIPKQKVKELSLVYQIDKTTAFYKKYRNIRQQRQYLSIKSVEFSNHNRVKNLFEKHYVKLHSFKTNDNISSYVFKVNSIPSEKLEFLVNEKNFKREAKVYASNDLKTFTYLKHFSISSSTFNTSSNLKIDLKNRTQYLKIELEDKDNKLLIIEGIKILAKPSYLYFIAEPNEKYTLYFGDKNLKEPNYEIKSIVTKRDIYEVGIFSKVEILEVSHSVNEVSFMQKYKETLFILLLLTVLGIMSYIAFSLIKSVK
jgi:hypothetical protein